MGEATYCFQTKLLHNQHKVDPNTGAVSVPIQPASTFHQFDMDHFGQYDYSRSGNPTRAALEDAIADLEGGVQGFAFASGMAAISTAFMLLSQGDHVLLSEDVYGGTYRMTSEVLGRFGIEHTFVDTTDIEMVARHIQSNTKVIYIETPSNPLLKITDIRAVTELAQSHGCLTFVDNTFATPAVQRPLELGADVVLHSATKFIAGHSDVVAGLAVVKDQHLGDQIAFLQNSFGAILGVQDAWLVLRGLKTLQVRMNQSTASAKTIAAFLEEHPSVDNVYYPGLASDPGRDLHLSQANDTGAVLSFSLHDEAAVRQLTEHMQIPVFSVSLGAVESILSYPAKMSHASMPAVEREKRGITDGLLRLSVGLEDHDDLIQDLTQALSGVEAAAVSKQ
ncbi:cystathionine beta-lyase [Tuberibacillus sp. Marseille-P3662]|uniref:cystathionine beta-lyase n=1 Tax=Tuberibacillus sp. Marseille-P3662 TaxID=1965358 RepID=UPI000A1C8766|nr:cystathionine beta-lyase [Tuberibacillus sp. Marseille-P3662]